MVVAGETKSLISEGVASIEGDNEHAHGVAIEDAKKRAVEQAIGMVVEARIQVRNYRLIDKKILSRSDAYITKYAVVNEIMEDSLLRVQINAEVAFDRLSEELSRIAITSGRMSTVDAAKSVSITIIGLNKAQFMKFMDEFKNHVRGVKNLRERSFMEKNARISVDIEGGAQSLSRELLRKGLGPFTVEVVGSAAQVLELKVTSKYAQQQDSDR